MDTKINKAVLSNWATNIYDLNSDAVENLTEFKNLVHSIPDSYNCSSSEATIINMIADLDNAINCHTDMESLQAFLESVIKSAENA